MQIEIKTLDQTLINEMKKYNIWSPECPVPLGDLNLINLLHYDFRGNIIRGQIIVHKKIAEITANIFQQLLKRKFPIHSVKLIQEFQGDDVLSMEANNSSAFNFRQIAGTSTISIHSYGLAIDINPVQNPYITHYNNTVLIQPSISKDFLDRTHQKPGMVENIVELFVSHGFNWGGHWKTIKDYHHFEFPLDQLFL
ncbi:MAG: M15 family metallopeptidase [Rickettsiaceae bacterium]|nr:M15 family metallopeptidase [Rickettsiaceae bacterium]